ncbi:hypothetical protein C8R43DRAFT_976983 [Mycena crocata]|nr:hypothetical protein C8R43DRAFT_976983 [Mycena crocata]
MASETQLRKRIHELSAAIEHQKQVLRDLEKSKSEAQGHLNAILDPMTRLPLELSSDIFLRCIADFPVPSADAAPLVFLNVCRAWRDIALSTPALWTAIRVQFPRHPDFRELLDLWFSRARFSSLSLSLYADPQTTIEFLDVAALDPTVVALVHKNANRMRHLELYLPFGRELKQITASFPCLEVLTIGQGERYGDWTEEDSYSATPDECVEILEAAPNIVECAFKSIRFREWDREPSSITLSCLQHLRFDGIERWRGPSNTAVILPYLILPTLQSLSISEFHIRHDALLAFLTRSSPPLRSLTMDFPPEWTSAPVVKSVFQLLPNLTDLDLWTSWGAKLAPFLEALSTSDLLPILRNLTIRDYQFHYEPLIAVFTSRQEQLKTFSIISPSEPDANFLIHMRQCVTDGIHIYVGTEERNYI